jgi:hypothetical protein
MIKITYLDSRHNELSAKDQFDFVLVQNTAYSALNDKRFSREEWQGLVALISAASDRPSHTVLAYKNKDGNVMSIETYREHLAKPEWKWVIEKHWQDVIPLVALDRSSKGKPTAWQNTGDPRWIVTGNPPDNDNWIPLYK